MRQEDFIDLYFVDKGGNLVHLYASPLTGWVYNSEIIYNGVQSITPLCFRFGDFIDVYCVDGGWNLVHLYASQLTGFQYVSGFLRQNGKPISSLAGVRTKE